MVTMGWIEEAKLIIFLNDLKLNQLEIESVSIPIADRKCHYLDYK